MKKLLLLILVFTSMQSSVADNIAGFDWKPFSLLAIQDRGRLKPMNTFAAESVQYITGKRSWQGMPPEALIFGWMATFEDNWQGAEFVLVDHKPMKDAIGIDAHRRHFAPEELIENQELGKLSRAAYQKSQMKEELTTLEKRASEVNSRLVLLQAIVSGSALTIFPNPDGLEETWYPISSLTGQANRPLPYAGEKIEALGTQFKSLIKAYLDGNTDAWNENLPKFTSYVGTELTKAYPKASTLKRELHYNTFRPFRWSWVLYTVAFMLLVPFIFTGNKSIGYAGFGALIAGFGVHSYGFVIRSVISERPPVTNMYESVIWVSWGCVLFAGIIWAKYKNAVIPAAATVFSVVSLILADNLPSILDPSINPLEPVLRSNFWLTIHVLTITLSYAAFALSLCLGNVVLGNHAFTPSQSQRIQQLSLFMYRSMQIGVILLAAGTILGGVWADYSWGRFWGWDPKEVWALIALLMYLAVLHGRFTGWLRGFGFAAVTVLSFLGVLMAWYGVNFVLGAGLHSYGFGTGGSAYIIAYIIGQLAFIGLAYSRHAKAKAAGEADTAIFPKGHR